MPGQVSLNDVAPLLLALVACLVVIAALGSMLAALATRLGMSSSIAMVCRFGIPGVCTILVLAFVVAFRLVARADTVAKSLLLARGISEAMTCTPLSIPASAIVIGAAVWLFRRSPT